MRKYFALTALCITSALCAQNQKKLAIGIKYGYETDFNQEVYQSGGFINQYKTNQSNIGLTFSYPVWNKLRAQSEAGLSIYNTDLHINPNNGTGYSNNEGLSNKNIYVAQQFEYEVLSIPLNDCGASFSMSPFIRMSYTFNTNKRTNKRGHININNEMADLWIEKHNLPIMDATFKSPFGFFALTPGLNLDFMLRSKIGINLFGGYQFGLAGHTTVDARYRYKDDTVRNISFKSKDSGFYFGGGLKYFF